MADPSSWRIHAWIRAAGSEGPSARTAPARPRPSASVAPDLTISAERPEGRLTIRDPAGHSCHRVGCLTLVRLKREPSANLGLPRSGNRERPPSSALARTGLGSDGQ